ncbi:hypothetical protein AGMMS49957_16270 [Synergistales bacterium]|nr:hypothetical protein AGMMS49957_16270 [Synergistales bacterium]
MAKAKEKAKHTKAHTTFKNRIVQFDADLELADVVRLSITASGEKSTQSARVFEQVDNTKYPALARSAASEQGRKLAVTHLVRTLQSAYIKDLYEEFSIYLRTIVAEVWQNSKVTPKRLTGDNTSIKLPIADVLRHIADNTINGYVIDTLFNTLAMERSTAELIKKFCNKIGLSINEETIDNAVEYFEIRHKLVHTDGYADDIFKKQHPALQYTGDGRIVISFHVVTNAKNAVVSLVDEIDKQCFNKDLVQSHLK